MRLNRVKNKIHSYYCNYSNDGNDWAFAERYDKEFMTKLMKDSPWLIECKLCRPFDGKFIHAREYNLTSRSKWN